MRLLVLSNGHGEDAIALRILQALRQKNNPPEIAALPIVGEGHAYTQHHVPVIGAVRTMPSGGFVYMDGRQLARDLRGGLLQLTWTQLRAVRRWVKGGKGKGEKGSGEKQSLAPSSPPFILAVGDIVPLLFAWLSGVPYAFVGTAKSEYYLRDEAGWLPRKSWWDDRLQRWFGSDYLPWERWLLSRPQCKAVFCRDQLTADTLQKFGVPALHLGNPMMDGLAGEELPSSDSATPHSLTFVLLPGSRPPEAYENWRLIMQAVMELVYTFSDRPLRFLAAIAPGLFLEPLNNELVERGWQPRLVEGKFKGDEEKLTSEFTYRNAVLVLTQHAFGACLHRGDLAIAMAGTATEQFVGLGKPAIILPGKGPQFTPNFAEAQTRLLGPSVILVQQPKHVPTTVQALLNDPDRLHLIAENGHRRMGKPGSGDLIATYLIQHLL
jgi:uncharacterized protein (TIGR03492 family)